MNTGHNLRAILVEVVVLAASLLAVGVAHPVKAAFPGANCKIAFRSERRGNQEIHVINADSPAAKRLTTNAASDVDPD